MLYFNLGSSMFLLLKKKELPIISSFDLIMKKKIPQNNIILLSIISNFKC